MLDRWLVSFNLTSFWTNKIYEMMKTTTQLSSAELALLGSGAFHDRSTKILSDLHPTIFYFDEILSIGFSYALKSMVTTPEPYGQRFRRYSPGHFDEVTLQSDF